MNDVVTLENIDLTKPLPLGRFISHCKHFSSFTGDLKLFTRCLIELEVDDEQYDRILDMIGEKNTKNNAVESHQLESETQKDPCPRPILVGVANVPKKTFEETVSNQFKGVKPKPFTVLKLLGPCHYSLANDDMLLQLFPKSDVRAPLKHKTYWYEPLDCTELSHNRKTVIARYTVGVLMLEYQ